MREDDDLRGREPGEVAHLIAETVGRAKPALPLTIIPDEAEPVDQALDMARPGDLVVVFVDRVDETIAQVQAASRARKVERSEQFWVSVSATPPAGMRSHAEHAATLSEEASANRRETQSQGKGSSGGPEGSGDGKRNGKQDQFVREVSGDFSLPRMFGDDAEGSP